MRLAQITFDSQPRLAIVQGDKLQVTQFARLVDYMETPEELKVLQTLDRNGTDYAWRPAVEAVEKIICIGRNYAEHAKETGAEIPDLPVVFNKFPSALTSHQSAVQLPALSEQVDFEAELVVVIGREGKDIPRESALSYVFGATCGNDISARDWQKGKPGGQWLLGKTFDTFAPLGPSVVTMDEIGDLNDLEISLKLNGDIMQQSNTRHLIFPVDFLISHLSRFCTLRPGDLIYTGTPSGVGAARTPPQFLQAGDQMTVSISGCDDLCNHVVLAE